MSRKLVRLFIAIAVAAFPVASFAATPAPNQGSVKGNTLASSAFPVGSISIDRKFNYIGTTSFVLYEVADCEIHVFAELDGKRVQRFYWIQFEGYLATKPHNHYDYSKDPQRTMLGGHAFHERVWFRNIENAGKTMRPGSDSVAVWKLFEDNGLTLGTDIMQMRLVRLDESKRRELMIIYSESLSLQSLKAADFAEGGSAVGKREMVIDGLRQRAIDGLTMNMP